MLSSGLWGKGGVWAGNGSFIHFSGCFTHVSDFYTFFRRFFDFIQFLHIHWILWWTTWWPVDRGRRFWSSPIFGESFGRAADFSAADGHPL